MSARYALKAAEKMHEALDERLDDQASALAAALRIGCSTLEKLALDCQPEFPLYNDIHELRERYKSTHKPYDCITNIKLFIEAFLFIEKRALIESGASVKLVDYLFKDIDKVHKATSNIILLGDEVRKNIVNLQHSVCEIEREIKTFSAAQEKRDKLRRWVKRGLIGVAGGGIIGLNATTDATTTLGLAPWMTALSGAMGSAFISEAYHFGE